MFVAQPLPEVEGVTREKLVLMCRFDTEGKKSNFSYQWTRSGQPKSADPEIIKGANSNILILESRLYSTYIHTYQYTYMLYIYTLYTSIDLKYPALWITYLASN